LSQADHRLNRVQDWVTKHIQTISTVTGLTIRALDFSDDRLAAILRYLNVDESWQEYEQEQGSRQKFLRNFCLENTSYEYMLFRLTELG